MIRFNSFNLATMASVAWTSFKKVNGKYVQQKTEEKNMPSKNSPRPCFGYIWTKMDGRTSPDIVYDYNTEIFVNCDLNWAAQNNYRNYCNLTDSELKQYLDWVANLLPSNMLTISCKKEKGDNKAVLIVLDFKKAHMKHIMGICNLIRYAYEFPKSNLIKSVMLSYNNHLFFDDIGQIFCIFETLFKNISDQFLSNYSEIRQKEINDTNVIQGIIFPMRTEDIGKRLLNFPVKDTIDTLFPFTKISNDIRFMLSSINNKASDWELFYHENFDKKKDEIQIPESLFQKVSLIFKSIIINA